MEHATEAGHAMPTWVKAFLIAAAVLGVLVVGVLVFGDGDHGPGRHLIALPLAR